MASGDIRSCVVELCASDASGGGDQMTKILLVEDHPELRYILQRQTRVDGVQHDPLLLTGRRGSRKLSWRNRT